MICALALMGGQRHQAVGIEWLVVATGAARTVVRVGTRGDIRDFLISPDADDDVDGEQAHN